MQKSAPQTGFTLLEMLIAVAIVGILIGVALPSFMETLGQAGTAGAVKTMNGALNLTRSEAISRARTINLCPSNTAATDCAAAGWSNGWIVFIDNNNDADGASGSIDSGGTTPDEILQVFEPSTEVVVTADSNLLGYNSRGFGIAGAIRTFKFCPEDNDANNARSIEINAAGSARIIQGGLTCP